MTAVELKESQHPGESGADWCFCGGIQASVTGTRPISHVSKYSHHLLKSLFYF